MESGYSKADLRGKIGELIRDYSRGGEKYDPADHNNTSSALLCLEEFFKSELPLDLYLSYQKGFSSFCNQDAYISEYVIEGDEICVSFSKGFSPAHREVTAKLSLDELEQLVDLFRSAASSGLLGGSDTAVTDAHGVMESYAYSFEGNFGRNCDKPFQNNGDPRAERLQERFQALIRKITDPLFS